eukprot:TRINITY_DN182190_c0_g1_i1.p1 TRINITY_DN182190_c0_g1~~TRINITY_DN182190_c0_g1_i1.p1  ORF type:complete len:684 (-),score=126.44 TRINITY_DN182190_c0_g1_i1:140-2191(-)
MNRLKPPLKRQQSIKRVDMGGHEALAGKSIDFKRLVLGIIFGNTIFGILVCVGYLNYQLAKQFFWSILLSLLAVIAIRQTQIDLVEAIHEKFGYVEQVQIDYLHILGWPFRAPLLLIKRVLGLKTNSDKKGFAAHGFLWTYLSRGYFLYFLWTNSIVFWVTVVYGSIWGLFVLGCKFIPSVDNSVKRGKSLKNKVKAKIEDTSTMGAFNKWVHVLYKKCSKALDCNAEALVAIFLIGTLVVGSLGFIIFYSVNSIAEFIHLGEDMTELVRGAVDNSSDAIAGLLGDSMADFNITTYVEQGLDWIHETYPEYASTAVNVYELWEQRAANGTSTATDITDAVQSSSIVSEFLNDPWGSIIDAYSWFSVSGFQEKFMEMFQTYKDTVLSSISYLFGTMGGLTEFLLFCGQSIVGSILSVGSNISSLIVSAILFLSLSYTLLTTKGDVTSLVIAMLPVSVRQRETITNSLSDMLKSFFVVSFKLMAFNALYTWLLCSAFGIRMPFFASIVAACFSVLPCFPVILLSLVCSLQFVFEGHYLWAAAFFCFHHVLPTYIVGVDVLIYEEIKGSHPQITGLSVFAGISTFGLSGAIFGPLLILVGVFMYSIVSIMMDTEEESEMKGVNAFKRVLSDKRLRTARQKAIDQQNMSKTRNKKVPFLHSPNEIIEEVNGYGTTEDDDTIKSSATP